VLARACHATERPIRWADSEIPVEIRAFQPSDEAAVILLWDELIATAMTGYEGHRGWVNYLAVAPNHQGKGFGRKIMGEAEKLLAEAGCPKVNVQVRGTNSAAVEFYQRLGYRIDDVVSLGRRIEHDDQE
jgi:ribosomal protein S18 acetylase RimI-like enzyme